MNIHQIGTMLSMQAEMNRVVNPDWINANYPFLRAVIVEGGEAMEHHGWKWWKLQVENVAELKLELIDILHFYLSHHVMSSTPTAEAMQEILDQLYAADSFIFDTKVIRYEELAQIDRLEYMIGLAVARRFDMRLLLDAWTACGANIDDLFRSYAAKNILNIFRQRNGYKDGTYIKMWQPDREDNEYLSEIMNAAPAANDPDFVVNIMNALQTKYSELTGKAISK